MKHTEKFILWFSGLQLYGVALRDTVHLYHVTSYFLLYPLLYGVALSDSVISTDALKHACLIIARTCTNQLIASCLHTAGCSSEHRASDFRSEGNVVAGFAVKHLDTHLD